MSMSRIENLTIPSRVDGLPLAVCLATPESGEPKALVQLAHGMVEHKGRYLPFMTYLADHGYAAVSNELESKVSEEDIEAAYAENTKNYPGGRQRCLRDG